MPVFNPRRRAGILLPACSSIILLLASSCAFAQSRSDKTSRDSLLHAVAISNRLTERDISAGTDKDGAQLLQRLNGVVVENKAGSGHLTTLNVFGFGANYNQVLLNGAPLTSFSQTGRAYPLGLIPVEAIGSANVQRPGNSAVPADFFGGTISIQTKDMPDKDFFLARVGGGFSDATIGKDFYTDRQNTLEWLSFPGAIRDLPGIVPNTRARIPLSQLNPQMQSLVSRSLKNNLAPIHHGARPNDQVVLGWGRLIQLKKGEKIGIVAYLNHQGSQRIDESTVQVAPDIATNPYPFADAGKPLIASLSRDVNYRSAAQLSAILNASLLYGKNKISFKNFFVHQLTNTFTRRSDVFKPGEDSLAHAGVNYLTEEKTLLNPQLSGEHAFGEDSQFKMTWLASYAYYREKDPDERNFLLRQDSSNGNLFELAHPQVKLNLSPFPSADDNKATVDPSFVNSGRQWTYITDHNFNGRVDISVPFNLLNRTQVLSGGAGIQAKYRILTSDLLQTNGLPGYYPLNELLVPEHYYPGGLSVNHYFINGRSPLSGADGGYQDGTNRGNYVASSNLGSAHIKLEGQITGYLSLNLGLRLETISQLVSTTQYVYTAELRDPDMTTIDKNTRNTKTDLLPSVELVLRPLSTVRLHAAWGRTVHRPQLQQLAPYRHYDALSFLVTTGNPILANTVIDNYDAGLDWMPRAGTQISISGFYKRMDQPIENIVSPFSSSRGTMASTPNNTPPTDLRGLTASFKTNLEFIANAGWMKNLFLFAGGSWLDGTVPGGPVRSYGTPVVAEHTLSGSPDYTLNAGLVMQYPRWPMLTVLYNHIGDYISAVGSGARIHLANGNIVSVIPDYRIKARDQLDLQVAQKFYHSRIQLIAGVNNLANNAYVEYQDLNGNKKFDQPLSHTIKNNSGGYFNGGVDNTVLSTKPQRTYYLTVSYLFK